MSDQDIQKIVDLLKSEASKAYAPGDDDDFADGIRHAYLLIEAMADELSMEPLSAQQ